jgi:hypothetical protein
MADKREPTDRTNERSGEEAADGPPDLPEGAERAEYADYRREGDETSPEREEEAEREAGLQPGDGDEEA